MEKRITALESEVAELRLQLTQLIDALYESNEHYQTIDREVNSTLKNDMGNMSVAIDGMGVAVGSANSAIDDLAVAILEG